MAPETIAFTCYIASVISRYTVYDRVEELVSSSGFVGDMAFTPYNLVYTQFMRLENSVLVYVHETKFQRSFMAFRR